jgi:hypothetical protein
MSSLKIIGIVKKNWVLFWLLMVVALMPVVLNHQLHRWWHFRQTKRQFQSEVDPVKLQLWATNILAQNYWKRDSHRNNSSNDSTVSAYPQWYITNLPPGSSNLVEKYNYTARVEVHPDYVVVFGNERGGEPELFVGSTNFVWAGDNSEMWHTGIYIVIPESEPQ